MTTATDDFPDHSEDPDLKPVKVQPTPQRTINELEYQELKVLLRLLIGTAAEGSDEFARRARLWQAEMNNIEASSQVISLENETDAARLRYTLVGFLFQAIDAGYSGASFIDKVTSRTLTTVSFLLSPLTQSRVWRPVRTRFNSYTERGESVVNTWMAIGRREEQVSRHLARKQAYEQIINDAIDYLADKPEVSDLIQQQSVSMAGEILDDIRERSSQYDSQLEDRIKRLLRRK